VNISAIKTYQNWLTNIEVITIQVGAIFRHTGTIARNSTIKNATRIS